jgi:hypothetical protein
MHHFNSRRFLGLNNAVNIVKENLKHRRIIRENLTFKDFDCKHDNACAPPAHGS